MIFDRLFNLFSSVSSGVPSLYPGLSRSELEQFLTRQEYERIKSFDNVYILPFFSQNSEAKHKRFGLGLSRLMIRNMMLLRDVSIHGPEDTPQTPYETTQLIAAATPRSSYITGKADLGSGCYSLEVEFHRPGRPVASAQVAHEDFPTFVRKCSTSIAELLGSTVYKVTSEGWSVGQPRHARSLIQCGSIHLDHEAERIVERGNAAKEILDEDPDFIVASWDIDSDLPGSSHRFFSGIKRDPFNAQLCFLTYCAVWTSKGPQPNALQFCRKAIELSPGHGKAHMCAPHAAHNRIAMLRHSELGYRLLPGNSFAVNNYTLALNDADAPLKSRIELAEEGIAVDPRDPGNYLRLIELCTSAGDYKTALSTAERLHKLYVPKIDERALYCLRQNPMMAKLIDSGEFDPVDDNGKRIAKLRRYVIDRRPPRS